MDLGAIPFSLNIFVKMLQSIVERGKEAHAGYAQKRKAYRLGTFGRLIGSLKFVFETEGAIATAAKSSRAKSPKPSAFVLFVWSLMQTLPESIREHVHSMPAMEKPISTKLKYWRRSGMQSGRTDCLLSQNGCGGQPMTGMYSDVTVRRYAELRMRCACSKIDRNETPLKSMTEIKLAKRFRFGASRIIWCAIP
jgi:hypothetical protein